MTSRFAAGLATAVSAPWRRAPRLLLRRPGVLVAVAGACAVMVAAVSSVPLFVGSVGTAANQIQADERCGPETGATLVDLAGPGAVRDPGPQPFSALSQQLGPVDRWAHLEGLTLDGGGPDRTTTVTMLARDGASSHVEVIDGGGSHGLWITDRAAEETGLGVGDVAVIGAAEVRVAAVYRDLAALTVDDYWCAKAPLLLLEERNGELVAPPPVILVDRSTFADVQAATGTPTVEAAWQAPLRPGVDVAEADMLADDLACRGPRSGSLDWCRDGQPLLHGGREARDDAQFLGVHLGSSLPYVVERTAAIQVSVGSGVWPVAAFATLAGAGLVVAASSLWFERRRREVALLTVRGVSPAGLGVKAVLELLPALVTGPVLGFVVAYAAVSWLGPSADFEPDAVRRATVLAVVAAAASAVTVGASVVLRVRETGRHRRGRLLVRIPWELGLVLGAVWSYRRLDEFGVPVDVGSAVSTVDVAGLLFPVLTMFTAVALFVRLVLLASGPIRSATRGAPMAIALAVRRVVHGRAATAGLLAATAVAAGVLGYATTMERSMHATLETKVATFVGADTAVQVRSDVVAPAALAGRSTLVQFQPRAWVDVDGRQESAGVLVVDPDTFADTAFWHDGFASGSLDEVVTLLDADAAGGALPAVVLGADVGPTSELEISSGGTRRLTVAPLDDVVAFPGMRRAEITVVLSASHVPDLASLGRRELWVRGDPDSALAALEASDVAYETARDARVVADGAAFRTVSWTFGFMRALGLVAAVLVVGAVFVHLDARHRERLLAHAFLRRMGMSERQHGRALAIELAASVLVGCVAGLAFALAVAGVAHGHMDPVPRFAPAPFLRPTWALVLGAVCVSGALVLTGAVLSQRRLERGDAVEVLRGGL